MKGLARGLVGGQPTARTHPHLFAHPAHIVPGITGQEFTARRAALLAALPTNSLAIVPSYKLAYSSQNIFYRFHQSNNMAYLCGFNEPNSCLVMDGRSGRSIIFHDPADEHRLVWEGPAADAAILKRDFGFDLVYNISDFKDYCRSIDGAFAVTSANDCVDLRDCLPGFTDLAKYLHALRAVKSKDEQELMRRSAKIASAAFASVIKASRKEPFEQHLEALMEFECKRRGASGLSYVPVVAGGPRACVVHYTRNDQKIGESDLLLMDAGAMYSGYCSDVTRTWPVSGRFTKPQLSLYKAVFSVQAACLGALRKQKMSMDDLNVIAYWATVSELSRLGFRRPEQSVGKLYPHSIGHHLGMDLHDCPSLSGSDLLVAGNVITVEPGLYVADTDEFPDEFRGIGVRIEDDVIITEDGFECLTAGVPKDPEHLEYLLSTE